MDDEQLLQSYAAHRSEDAFRELVRRHIAIVHGVARRQPGIDCHLADDVTQRVFVALARKAHSLLHQPTLVGWLYTAARLEAARVVRSEARRRNWEGKASAMSESPQSPTDDPFSWEELKPALDAAMSQLGDTDQKAILLRFFSGQSFAEVGEVFAISEEAARKRVERATDKLREALQRRGFASTSMSLGAALGARAAPPVSDEAVSAVVTEVWAQVSATWVLPWGITMSSTKITIVVTGAVILLAGTSAVRDARALGEGQHGQLAAKSEMAKEVQQLESLQRELSGLREERANADAAERELILTTPNPTRPYLQDPEYRALARTASQARRHLEFQRFYRQLQLTPAQTESFEHIMVRQDQANLDAQIARDLGRDEQAVSRQSGPEWNAAMRDLLGADGMNQLQDYLRSMAVRNFVDEIAAKSYETGDPITLAQSDRLTALALTHDPLYQQGKGTDPGKVSWNDVWAPAAQFLSPQQIITFETAVEVWSLQKRISLAKPKGPAQ